jgi:hypothetical protein
MAEILARLWAMTVNRVFPENVHDWEAQESPPGWEGSDLRFLVV